MGSERYVLDVNSSQFTVQAFAEGLAGIADHRPRFSIRKFLGELQFGPDQEDWASLNLTAQAGSLEIMDEVTERDRKAIEGVMFGEVLRPQLYPEVVFRSSQVVCRRVQDNRYLADVAGMLSLHGVESAQSIQAQLVLTNESLRAYGEFRLRQTDHGIAIASVAGGMIRIKDEVKFVFFFVARKANGA